MMGFMPPATDPDADATVDHSPAVPRSAPTVLILVGVVLVALNLRVAVTSLGALLTEVSDGVGLSGTLAGVATMLPTLSFAIAGSTTPWLVRRLSPARILVLAMVLLGTGQLARAVAGSAPLFLVCSALALAGIAVANVLLPALVKQYFPDRIGLVTGAYTMTMILGTSAAAAASVPVAQAAGSWRVGLGAWAVLAALAVLPWLPAALRSRAPAPGTPVQSRIRPARTGLGWAMAVFFGSQSLGAYAMMGWLAQLFRDAGFPPATAGLLLALVTAVAAPVAFLVPSLTIRLPDLRPLILVLSAASVAAYLGLALAPAGGAVLWVLLVALGQATFPLGLTLFGLRARTPAGTVALSAFAQSTGYLIAGLGPLLVGILYGTTGGWTVPLGFLVAVIGVQAAAGMVAARPRYLEDQ